MRNKKIFFMLFYVIAMMFVFGTLGIISCSVPTDILNGQDGQGGLNNNYSSLDLAGTSYDSAGRALTVNWRKIANVKGYEVYVNGHKISTTGWKGIRLRNVITRNAKEAVIVGLDASKKYKIQIKAKNTYDEYVGVSEELEVMHMGVVANSVKNVMAQRTFDTIVLSWENPPSAEMGEGIHKQGKEGYKFYGVNSRGESMLIPYEAETDAHHGLWIKNDFSGGVSVIIQNAKAADRDDIVVFKVVLVTERFGIDYEGLPSFSISSLQQQEQYELRSASPDVVMKDRSMNVFFGMSTSSTSGSQMEIMPYKRYSPTGKELSIVSYETMLYEMKNGVMSSDPVIIIKDGKQLRGLKRMKLEMSFFIQLYAIDSEGEMFLFSEEKRTINMLKPFPVMDLFAGNTDKGIYVSWTPSLFGGFNANQKEAFERNFPEGLPSDIVKKVMTGKIDEISELSEDKKVFLKAFLQSRKAIKYYKIIFTEVATGEVIQEVIVASLNFFTLPRNKFKSGTKYHIKVIVINDEDEESPEILNREVSVITL